jgi:hypothetical protein
MCQPTYGGLKMRVRDGKRCGTGSMSDLRIYQETT